VLANSYHFIYDSGMNIRRFIVAGVCLWAILLASIAAAGPMHTHARHIAVADDAPWKPHVVQAVSPFKLHLKDKRLHCELLGHSPLLPCPHHKVPAGEKTKCYISNECSGGPLSAPSARSFGDSPRFLVPVASAADDSQFGMNTLVTPIFYDSIFSHSLDRPPRAL